MKRRASRSGEKRPSSAAPASTARSAGATKAVARKAATALRAYRFDTRLFARFEGDCARHLRNPRSVLEALIYHWVEADPQHRDAIAAQYQQGARPNDKLTRPRP